MSNFDHFLKRSFDLVIAALGLVLLGWAIGAAALLARIDTGQCGIFCQSRVGRHGRIFSICKLRTMRDDASVQTHVTTANDPRITRFGKVLRRWKIDELPQLFNVLVGDMSLVGPRPDMPEFRDQIERESPLVLTVRPGITGPATLKYRDEEALLAAQRDPETYNAHVILPDKIRINEAYIRNYRFRHDLRYVWLTLLGTKETTLQSIASSVNPHGSHAA